MHRVPRPLSITHGWWVYTLFIGVHLEGVSQALKDGLLHGCGDAVIGIDPATDSPAQTRSLLELLSAVIERYEIPMQSCVLAHVTTTLRVMEEGAPVDLILQSVAGIEGGNRGSPHPRPPGQGASWCVRARLRHRRPQRHLLRDRPGLSAVR